MKQATIISFVRHGQVQNPGSIFYGRLPGFGLDARGREEARRAARTLGAKKLAAVFSSPLLRARQTAREIAARHGAPGIRLSALLTEVCSVYEGAPQAEVAALGDDIYTGASPGFEQPADIVARMQKFAQGVRRQYAGRQVAAVTHGDPIVFFILWSKGLPLTPHNKLRLSLTGVLDGYPALGSIATCTYATADAEEKPALRYELP